MSTKKRILSRHPLNNFASIIALSKEETQNLSFSSGKRRKLTLTSRKNCNWMKKLILTSLSRKITIAVRAPQASLYDTQKMRCKSRSDWVSREKSFKRETFAKIADRWGLCQSFGCSTSELSSIYLESLRSLWNWAQFSLLDRNSCTVFEYSTWRKLKINKASARTAIW